jgi:uncharacterized membrane protein
VTGATRAARLRLAGRLVLVCGIAGACLFYWIRIRSAAPALDESAAGYARAQQHQMGVMMGTLGVLMAQWMDALAQPGAEALLIAASAALVAGLCFRVAFLMDLPQSDPRAWPAKN